VKLQPALRTLVREAVTMWMAWIDNWAAKSDKKAPFLTGGEPILLVAGGGQINTGWRPDQSSVK
jgi:hypothetical protein